MSKTSTPPNHVDTLVELLQWRAEQQGSQRGYVFLDNGASPSQHLNYGELDRRCRSIAARLQEVAAPGDRALLLYPAGLDFVTAFFACLYAGLVAVPAYPPHPSRRAQTGPVVRAIVRDSGATVVLTTGAIASIARPFLEEPSVGIQRWMATDDPDHDASGGFSVPRIQGSDTALIQYTSGSTREPRGVKVDHGNLLSNSASIHQCFGHSSKSRGVIWLPPYHDMGLIGGILQPLYGGFPVTLMSPISFLMRPLRWLQAISDNGATTSGGPNFAYDLCVRRTTAEQRRTLDLSSWTIAFNGAEPVHEDTLDQFARTFEPCGFRREAFCPCYGLAEATLLVTAARSGTEPVRLRVGREALEKHDVRVATRREPMARTLVGCGPAADGVELIIVNPESSTRCKPNEVGEVWVAGPGVAQGYWNQPSVTQRVFGGSVVSEPGPFLRTGDLGFLHQGELFVTGRLKDIMILGGRNHYPQDVERTAEQVLSTARPATCVAFSVEVDGVQRLVVVAEVDRRILAAYRDDSSAPQPAAACAGSQAVAAPVRHEKAIATDIRSAVHRRHDLMVHEVVLVQPGTVPRTSSGKVRRQACRRALLEGSLERTKP